MKFIIDMDGVVYRGSKPLPYASEFIRYLQDNDIEFVFATNNSTLTREKFAEKLARMGIHVSPERIITSSYATAEYLKAHDEPGAAIIVGEMGVEAEARRAGWEILPLDEWRRATHVLVGMDRTLTYEKLKFATLALNNGARFVATNGDVNFPSEEGLIPGAGSMVAALEAASGKKALVIGKPNDPYIEIIRKVLGEGEYYMVGDRTDTDMILGRKIGAKNVLLLTGVAAKPEGLEDFVFRDLGEFLEYLKQNK
ncbi:MAG: HAD-IIA family hydrolase [Euryarchaeota archaeon]|nr:HAD-IIA family hydrolase [Euryarchaeota archaeon]